MMWQNRILKKMFIVKVEQNAIGYRDTEMIELYGHLIFKKTTWIALYLLLYHKEYIRLLRKSGISLRMFYKIERGAYKKIKLMRNNYV